MPRSKFKTAVEVSAEIKNCYQQGLQALGVNSQKIMLNRPRDCQGSVNLDACLTHKYPTANRWDYCFCYQDNVYFVEVHSTHSGEVDTVLAKLEWLKSWLQQSAAEIYAMRAASPYYWVQTGKYAILPGSPQARRMAQAGLKPASRLRL